jgi:sodium-dependent dicarboxylate transporter 2/3/5
MVLLAFAIPSGFNFWPFKNENEHGQHEAVPSSPLIGWSGKDGVEKRLQWGVILLLGGGFALSNACETSGKTKIL